MSLWFSGAKNPPGTIQNKHFCFSWGQFCSAFSLGWGAAWDSTDSLQHELGAGLGAERFAFTLDTLRPLRHAVFVPGS